MAKKAIKIGKGRGLTLFANEEVRCSNSTMAAATAAGASTSSMPPIAAAAGGSSNMSSLPIDKLLREQTLLRQSAANLTGTKRRKCPRERGVLSMDSKLPIANPDNKRPRPSFGDPDSGSAISLPIPISVA